MNLGEVLRLLRVVENLKQEELGTIVGCSRSHICELEKGKKTPSLELLKKYSNYFGVPISEIIKRAEELDDRQKNKEKIRAKLTTFT